MASFKDPSFQERTALANKAKQKALEQLKAKPKVDEAVLAERRAARIARDEAEAEKQAAKRAAQEQAEAAKEVAAAAESVEAAELTEADKKAARDAKYAARKKNKKKRR